MTPTTRTPHFGIAALTSTVNVNVIGKVAPSGVLQSLSVGFGFSPFSYFCVSSNIAPAKPGLPTMVTTSINAELSIFSWQK